MAHKRLTPLPLNMCHIIIMPIIIHVTIAIVCHDFDCDKIDGPNYKRHVSPSFESEILLARNIWLFCFGYNKIMKMVYNGAY